MKKGFFLRFNNVSFSICLELKEINVNVVKITVNLFKPFLTHNDSLYNCRNGE